MSWLVARKVLPPLVGGNPPDYTLSLPAPDKKSEPICWRISWNNRRVGTAASQLIRRSDGGSAQRHVVHFERLPLQAMLSEGFGLLGSAFKQLLGSDSNVELNILLATELRFNAQQRFTDFNTKGDIGDINDFLVVEGAVDEQSKLNLVTRLRTPIIGQPMQVLRHELPLPREALVNDAFAPRPELKNLRVGQRWTIPVYRPFPPNSAVQIIEAVAERLDVIVWDARDVETVLVVYREEAGSGLHSSREPIAREWIRADGVVVQRELRLSGLKILFERMSSKAVDPEIEMLDSDKHPRFWVK